MHGHLQRTVSMERPPICAANAEIVVQLSAAAIDGDHPRVRELLGDLLRCRTPGTDQDLSPVLQPLEDLLLLLHSMALTDELTGLQNRRGFLHRAARLLDLAARKLHGALLIYVDVDNLKNVNDSSGHEAGDDLLRRAAQVLRDVSGDHAVIARWRRREALRRTLERRPDLLAALPLTPDERKLLEDETVRVADALAREGYFGPFGVDAYRYLDSAERLRFQPRSEINARFSMGYPRGLLELAMTVPHYHLR